MATIVCLTTLFPSKLGGEIEQAGHRLFEALAVSEVLYLMEHEDIDFVVIALDVEDPEMAELHIRRPCIKLQPGWKLADLIWELSCLSGAAPTWVH